MATQVTLNSGSVDSAGSLALKTNGTTTAVTVDTSQNVGIGTSSPGLKLDVNGQARLGGSTGPTFGVGTAFAASQAEMYSTSTTPLGLGTAGAASFQFYTNSTERARIDSSGNLLVGATSAGLSSGPGLKFINSTTIPQIGLVANAVNESTYHLYNTNATNNGYRFYVLLNGGVVNYSGNNSNLSDERTKTNIELAGGYLEKICAIPVKLFNYKDEAEGEQRTLGVIAQDVEAVAPELVNNEGFGETPEDGVPLKSIYTTDMQFALMKCIQEQQALIQTLTTRIQALEGQA